MIPEVDLLELDRRYLWHPYTQMKDFEKDDPLFVDRADGVFLFDAQGRRYYDTISSWWCILHGHNHPGIKAAIRDQLDRLEHVHFAGTTHEGAIRLAEKLVALTPDGLSKVFYSDNGSTACEVAIKMSLQYWKHMGETRRESFVSLERGYHGDTIGAMSLGGVPSFKGPFDALTFDSYRIPSPYCYRCPYEAKPPAESPNHQITKSLNCSIECLDPLEKLLADKGHEIAGIILEPLLQAAGGMIAYPVQYLKRLAGLASHHRIHLILDEVATGFGRTGRMFAFEHAGIAPDFLCLSKGLTAGFIPMAATITTDDVYHAFYADYEEGRTFFHGHTFTGNPLASAAALASLEIFEQEKVLDGLQDKIDILQSGMERFKELPWVGDVRGIGMVAAVELVMDRRTRTPFSSEKRVGWMIYKEGLKKGLILRPLGDIVYLFLPLSVNAVQIEDILSLSFDVISGLNP
ncbi:MAG: adenosylmethionine--8-amino-7-oxononanoate transaminase [Deltaproteobacteria bacterium]|nr:adenosylmethionine--8-amino-7-oxononanoate transaminase [Deltaproteobacteria bacterium]MBW1966195.1 adenosylmethionine--8-amino-7-oxononanoate transaminase [Deltaproteobacteria bacterium]MBW2097515.1 adenosylmethionine--8-amino-7-oxononanoate transaminase [Deltaproteobacteria bacterium]